jgi:Flp pilus assembly protein protease CpaA
VNLENVGVASMVFGAIVVFVPQMAIAMFSKKGGIGGADIKISTAAALCLGFYGAVIGYMVGLIFAVVFQTIYNKVKKQSNKEAFPLLPFLSTGLMIGYII